jgi:outer membrane protein assembly factor BamA
VTPVRPLTLAARVFHYGRYGAHAEDERLPQLFVGYPSLVRGYEAARFRGGRCVLGGCPDDDPLAGSKLLVGNVELRIPAFFFRRDRPWGPVPAEVALFFDAGVAWTNRDAPRGLGGTREWARSYGAALRVNLFGFLVGEIDYVRPLDRPAKSSLFRFRIAPAF